MAPPPSASSPQQSWYTRVWRAATSAAAARVRGVGYYGRHPRAAVREVLNGVTVACMQVPESIAFSYIGVIDPIVGLYSTFFIGLFVAVAGGKPGMIGGLAGALMVVSGPQLMSDDGLLRDLPPGDRLQHYLLTVVVVGVAQLVIGISGLTSALRLIPRPAHVGFLNGLAIVILLAQVHEFQVCDAPGSYFVTCPSAARTAMSLAAGRTWVFLGEVAAAVGITLAFPRLPRVGKALPSSLVAILACTLFEHLVVRGAAGAAGTRTVGDTAAIAGTLPPLGLPHPPADGSGWRWGAVFQVAAMLTLIGTGESLLSLRALDAASTATAPAAAPPGSPVPAPAPAPAATEWKLRQECVTEGAGNLVGALCGSVGGGIMIGTSTVNLMSGSTGRLSGTVAALAVLAVVLVAAPAVALIPASALVGLMLVVVIRTADWGSVRSLHRMPRADAVQLVAVTVLCAVTNIAIGVAVGVVAAALLHVWRDSRALAVVEADSVTAVAAPTAPTAPPLRREGIRHLTVHGRLNFTTAWAFESALTAGLASAPAVVAVHFDHDSASRTAGPVLADYSALHAVCAAVKAHAAAGVSLRLCGVDAASASMLVRAGAVTRREAGILHLALAPLETTILDPPAALPPPGDESGDGENTGVPPRSPSPVVSPVIDVEFDARPPSRLAGHNNFASDGGGDDDDDDAGVRARASAGMLAARDADDHVGAV